MDKSGKRRCSPGMLRRVVADNKLLQIFLSTLYISAFTFGGGFVIVTFMKKKFVDELHWIEEEEMMDYIALAQSSPGAIAVNAAILVGWRVGNFKGMVTAVCGTVIPPIVILAALSFIYTAFASNVYIGMILQGMQAGIAAVILNVVWELMLTVAKAHRSIYWFIMAGAFISAFFFQVNVIYIILAALFFGVFLTFYKGVHSK